MGEKKDRGRFSIKFKENDPVHKKAIEILEGQGAHGKAQFIATAVVWYSGQLAMPEVSRIPPVQPMPEAGREYVRQIVMEVLNGRDTDWQAAKEDAHHIKETRQEKRGKSVAEPETEPGTDKKTGIMPADGSKAARETKDTNSAARSLIAATLSEFRSY